MEHISWNVFHIDERRAVLFGILLIVWTTGWCYTQLIKDIKREYQGQKPEQKSVYADTDHSGFCPDTVRNQKHSEG